MKVQVINDLREANEAPLMPKREAIRCMIFSIAPFAIGGTAFLALASAFVR